MEVSVDYKFVALLGLVGYAIYYWFYKLWDSCWLRPRKLEKCLREQGFRGNPYKLLRGDQYQSQKLIGEVSSKPIGLDECIVKRITPHILDAVQTHGKKCFTWNGRNPKVIVTDPELVREAMNKYHVFQKHYGNLDPIVRIIFTGVSALEGETWFKRRKMINPAFHLEKLKLMLPAFHLSCLDMVSEWDSKVSGRGSAEVEVWQEIKFLTADILSRTLYGCSYEEARRIHELIKELAALAVEAAQSAYFPAKRFLPTKRNNRARALNRELRARILDMINKRAKAIRAGEATGDNFLGILLEYKLREKEQQGNQKSAAAGLSTDELIDECIMFFFAGQDSSTTLIVWTMVLLSRFPEWQQRAREEIRQVFGAKDPDYDGLNRLKIVTMILHEVLRLYCLVPEISRVAAEDTKLGEYFIPAGVEIMMPQVLLHYDPEMWGEDVMEFNPERFSEGVSGATKSQGSYFPFTIGPRICIGENFIMLEAKMAMTLILQRFCLELSPSYVHAPVHRINIQPQHGVHLILHKL